MMAKISIIGGGVVGTIVGKGLDALGNSVIFFDINERRVKELRDQGFKATSKIVEAVGNSDIAFITVPTPTKRGKIDISYIRSAVGELAKNLKSKKGYYLVAVKSTVAPRTTERLVVPLLEKNSGKKVGRDIGVCMNPEFLTEIHKSWTKDKKFKRDFFNDERIVIGEFDKRSGDVLSKLYRPLKIPILRTNMRTAEMIKYASNCALALRISYWNEIFFICKKIGVDSNYVARVVGMDSRIGTYGTIHGKAFGGKCLPKDLAALIAFSREVGHEPKLLKAVEDVNKKIGKVGGVRE
ncbi:MAG: nucleotide sugar dehydrogenase [Candidatus Hadarchaeota archaeon]